MTQVIQRIGSPLPKFWGTRPERSPKGWLTSFGFSILFFFLCLLVCLFQRVQGQSYSLPGKEMHETGKYWGPDLSVQGLTGMGLSRIKGSGGEPTRFLVGWKAGLLISYDEPYPIRLTGGLILAERGYSLKSSTENNFLFEDRKVRMNYLDLPLSIHYEGGKKWRYSLYLGGYFSYLLAATFEANRTDTTGLFPGEQVSNGMKGLFHSVDYGFQVGGEYMKGLGGKRSERDWEAGIRLEARRGLRAVPDQGSKASMREYGLLAFIRYRFY